MSRKRGSDIWFVRSNGGVRFHPVTLEGKRLVWVFVAGMIASAIMGAVLAQTMSTLLWVSIMAIGMAVSGLWFIMTTRAYTDYSKTYNEYVKDKKNARNQKLHVKLAEEDRSSSMASPSREGRRSACHHGAERLRQIDALLCAGGPRRL